MACAAPRLVCVEGNIAAGKSTLLAGLAARGFSVLREPVDAWTAPLDGAPGGASMLSLLYAEPSRYAFAFQAFALVTRLSALREALDGAAGGPLICERSHDSDRRVFAGALREEGAFSAADAAAYDAFSAATDAALRPLGLGAPLRIYLRTPAAECYARLQRRARPGEEPVSPEYLTRLEARHDAWLLREPGAVVLDGRLDAETLADTAAAAAAAAAA
jgi:deoxyadenosine/deoxycytidine kinase